MKKFLIILVIPAFLFAHKLNLFLDYENGNLFISSYFANAKGCINCQFEVKDKYGNSILKDSLDKNGEYNYETNIEELSVTIDGGAGHIVTKSIEKEKDTKKDEPKVTNSVNNIDDDIQKLRKENQNLKVHIKLLEEQLNYFEVFKVIFGLILIALIFIFIKKLKKN